MLCSQQWLPPQRCESGDGGKHVAVGLLASPGSAFVATFLGASFCHFGNCNIVTLAFHSLPPTMRQAKCRHPMVTVLKKGANPQREGMCPKRCCLAFEQSKHFDFKSAVNTG